MPRSELTRIEVCGKTGTAQNPHGKDHSAFIGFAPYHNPKIAVAVYVENAGFGATYGVPIGSLMIERYLNGEISPARKGIEERMMTSNTIVTSGVKNIDAGTSVFRSLDWITIVLYLLLVTMGAVSIYAASYDFDNASLFDLKEFSGKQIMWIGLSIIVGVAILLLDYRIYKTYAYPIYGIVVLILLLTIFIAPNIKGGLTLGLYSVR